MFGYRKHVLISRGAIAVIAVFVLVLAAQPVSAIEIKFRSFSGAAAIGPPADAFAAKLESITTTTLGKKGTVKYIKISPRPAVPKQFKKSIVA